MNPNNIKENKIENFEIKRFKISKKEAKIFNTRIMYRDKRYIKEGTYTSLYQNNYLIMSNTPAELSDHMAFINKAHGHILISGLGIGMVISKLLKKDNIESITIIELNKEVIELVGDTYKHPKVKIINDNIFKWKPDKHYDFAWHDIWNNICEDNLLEMHKIRRRLKKHCTIQEFWCKNECNK